jgi:hypothetical protein
MLLVALIINVNLPLSQLKLYFLNILYHGTETDLT